MRGFAFGCWSLLLVACSPSRPPATVATTSASQQVVGGTTLLVPARVCLNTMRETTRPARGGQRGFVMTRAVAAQLTQQKAAAGATMSNGCEDALSDQEPSATIGRVFASPKLIARIRVERATRTIVTEIATRLLCFQGRGESACVEDDVMLSAIVLDADGRAIHAFSMPVESEEQAPAAVQTLLRSFAHGAPGSSAVGGPCHLREQLLDCSGS